MTAGATDAALDVPHVLRPVRGGADAAFKVLVLSAALVLLVAIAGVVLFLATKGWSALSYSGLGFLISDRWQPTAAVPSYGLGGDLAGSIVIGALGLFFALPVAIGTALLINQYTPARARRASIALIDLLAVVPGIVFGLWGLVFLQAHTVGLAQWLSIHVSFFPPFRPPVAGIYGYSVFLASVVVAIMILPFITSIIREVMAQVPTEACEAALALGGTRWGMVTDVILPFTKSGIIGASLLGLGRAMGETIAVVLVLSPDNLFPNRILGKGSGSIAEVIGTQFTSSSPRAQSALDLGGLTLLLFTLVICIVARTIVGRAGSGAR